MHRWIIISVGAGFLLACGTEPSNPPPGQDRLVDTHPTEETVAPEDDALPPRIPDIHANDTTYEDISGPHDAAQTRNDALPLDVPKDREPVCNTADCPTHARCIQGLCTCDPGYEMSENKDICQDIDECAKKESPCDPLAGCTNLEGTYVCGPCPETHVDVNEDASVCQWRYNACGVARDGVTLGGTLDAPRQVPYLPMVDADDTLSAGSNVISTYDCAPDTLETGPEVVYRFVTTEPGTFHAQVADDIGVDIDIHLVQNPVLVGSQMTGCIGRAHQSLTVENLPAGEYFVIADTWSDGTDTFAGAYQIAFEWTSIGTWQDVQIAPGIVWSRLRLVLPDSDQTINRVRVDLGAGWDVQPHEHVGCQSVASAGNGLGALVGINGTYYNASCKPLGMIRADGVTVSTNTFTGYVQRTVGWNPGEAPAFEWLEPEVDWPEVTDAIGGYPSLVTDGMAKAEALPDTPVWSDADLLKNPRAVVGVDLEGHLILLTVDGRTAAGDGLTTPDLASFLVGIDLWQAINLDGGGSTTMMVKDCWVNDVVNHPSDNKQADHMGGRKVGNGLYVK